MSFRHFFQFRNRPRIGKPFKNINGRVIHPVIVRFTTWRHRTEVYQARIKSKSAKYKIRLDLTKPRYTILREAQNFIWKDGKSTEIGNNGPVSFVFAGLNCQLVAKLKDDSFKIFDTFEAIKNILHL